MKFLRRYLDRIYPLFAKNGPYHKLYPIYEMFDTLLYSPSDTTRGAPHVRDGADLKRVMTYVVLATFPCILVAMWNTGYQANVALAEMGLQHMEGWRGSLIEAFGVGYNQSNFLACMFHGLLYFLPIYAVTLAVGGFWEVLFAVVRKHDVNEGFFVTSMLFTLTLPATIPLWQVALGISFGVVLGKEVFGGTGKNFLNPALVGRAFLYFAFPARMSGDSVWIAVDAYSGATPLALAAHSGTAGFVHADISWLQAFLGMIPGSLGETSTLACLIGGAFLLYTRIASWRIVLGVFAGMVITSLFFNMFDSSQNPMLGMQWYWHLVLGGFAFGMVFMATDPVSASMTNAGRWIFGMLIGFMTVLIRVINPAFPEGIMLAILFANVFAPLIDYCVIQLHIRKRLRRNVE